MRIDGIVVAFLGCLLISSAALPSICWTFAGASGSSALTPIGFTHSVLDEHFGWTS